MNESRTHKISEIDTIFERHSVIRFSFPAYASLIWPEESDLYAGKLDLLTE